MGSLQDLWVRSVEQQELKVPQARQDREVTLAHMVPQVQEAPLAAQAQQAHEVILDHMVKQGQQA